MKKDHPKPSVSQLERHALEKLARQHGTKDLVIAGMARDVRPSTGTNIYKFQAVRSEDPNGPHHSIVLDEHGKVVEPRELEKEGAGLFTPSMVPLTFAAGLAGGPAAGVPTINPNVNNLTLNLGDVLNEVITVTVPKQAGVAKVDVYFLADTTGSMSPILSAVQAGAGNILATLSASGLDIAFGVGNYRDFPQTTSPFTHQLALTGASAAVTTAINAWSAGGGGDIPEGQFFALDKLAQPPGGPIGWRAGAKRIIVWFGDAPGHDPICKAISGLTADITEASVTAKLTAEKIVVLAISTVTGSDPQALDGDPKPNSSGYGVCGAPGGQPGQAKRITNATGGQHVSGINAGNIVNTIINLVTTAISSIGNLKLVPAGGTAPFVVSISPAAGYGPLASDTEHTLKFDVTFKGVVPCSDKAQTFAGTIDVVADGAVIAQKKVSITVPACEARNRFVYSVKLVCGVQPECPCENPPVRPGVYATEINLLNPQSKEARVEKHVLPIVLAGAAAGREPNFVPRKASDKILLPPHSATMDDCHRVSELLLGGVPSGPLPLTIGFLEIISTEELDVTAVYTVSGPKSGPVSIDVEHVQPRVVKGT